MVDKAATISLDDVMALAEKLSPVDQARLIGRLADVLGNAVAPPANGDKFEHQGDLYGSFADLGEAPSAEDIDEIRREMWSNFPREDSD